jgi:hypothetical protein
MRLLRWVLGSAAALAYAHSVACSSDDAGSTVGSGNTSGRAGSGTGGSSSGGSAGNISTTGGASGSTGSGGGLGDAEACAGEEHTATQAPVDLFIMLDQSTSMTDPVQGGGNIWAHVTNAIKSFVNSPEADGIGVGIGYFGIGIAEPAVCGVAQYATPDVPIAQLPGVRTSIVTSIDAHAPSSFTPTGPALEGALQYAKTWAAANPERQTIVVLATDGYPTQCDPQSPSLIANFAATALAEDPKVFTFVIGIGPVTNLNVIAQAGGTREAFFIDPASQNVANEMTQALLRIAAAPLACSYPMPQAEDGGIVNPGLVNVDFSPSGGGTTELVQVRSAAECGRVPNGWYYDHPTQPSQINICPEACNGFGAGTLKIVLGCSTRPPPAG